MKFVFLRDFVDQHFGIHSLFDDLVDSRMIAASSCAVIIGYGCL